MSSENKNELGKRIKLYRVGMGLSQQEVADQIGVSQQTYSKYEKGTKIDNEIIIKLCKVFDITSDELLGIKDDIKPKKVSSKVEMSDDDINEIVNRIVSRMNRGQ